jgi:quercetin dioxygenase-like cupin family protein
MENPGITKGNPFALSGVVEYIAGSVAVRTLMKKITGTINAVAFASLVPVTEKISPFDIFIQIIEGTAAFTIDKKLYTLIAGESIIVPAHSPNTIMGNSRFKMLCITIKSGYEEVS